MSTPSFEFFSAPRILFGPGRALLLPDLSRSLGQRALLIHNGPPDRIHSLLGASIAATFRQRGEPSVADVDSALSLAREHSCDLVIGHGGGSAIDCAKALAGLLTNTGTPIDYMEVIGSGKKIEKPAAPWIAIPTTAGTGAEVTRNAVIASPAHQFKASLRSEHLLPRIALIDPELALDVPPDITARSGADALCQCIEAYTSNAANPISHSLAFQGIALAARSLRKVYRHPGDLEARSDMALAALLSGICLTNVGLGAVHGFAAPMGALFNIPHGTLCGLLLPHVIAANIQAARAESPDHPLLAKYYFLAGVLTSEQDVTPEHAAHGASRLIRDLDLPPLSSFGLTPADIPRIVPLAKKASSMRYNALPLSDAALHDILDRALSWE